MRVGYDVSPPSKGDFLCLAFGRKGVESCYEGNEGRAGARDASKLRTINETSFSYG